MPSHRSHLRGCLTIAASLAFHLGSHARAAEIRTVALTGQQAPATFVGVRFNAFTTPPRLNNAGHAAFEPTVTGTGVATAYDSGVWSENPDSLALLAREGSQAAGMPDGVLYGAAPFRTVLNNNGGTVIFSIVSGTGVVSSNDRAIWTTTAGALTPVIRRGAPAPGIGGVTLSFLQPTPRLNDAGQVIFSGTLSGSGVTTGSDTAFWLYDAGVASLVAREGSSAPGTPAGVNFFGDVGTTLLNSAGKTAFTNGLAGSGVTGSNDSAIWYGGAGSLALKIREGDAAPGSGAGVNFASFSFFPTFNGAGKIAFMGTVSGSGVSAANDVGIWSEGGGSLSLVAREGSLAGIGAGVNWAELSDPVMNVAGETGFRASLAGADINAANDTGLWLGLPGSLDLIAREGSQAPGTPDGVNFAIFDAPVLNAGGQIAFVGGLTGTGVNAANDRGIWATDAAGQLQLIIREGEQIEVAPGDMRTVNALGTLVSTGDDGGGPSGFNDSGQLAFAASFTDGASGAFVSSRVKRPGDFDGDGLVDADDLTIWRNGFSGIAPNLPADDDEDGDVDGADFLAWQRGFTPPGTPIQPAPEPSCSLLAALAVFAGFAARRSGARV